MSHKNASLKPIKLYGHVSGPNPWKVTIVLKALQIPYTTEWVDLAKVKEEPYTLINPNGRVPAIEDPNTGITLWESGAILIYLVEKYDKTRSLSFEPGSAAFHHMNQWLCFQISGQGPYMGQAAWFMKFHSEKLPSAIERYERETARVVGVINAHLERTGQRYLVADEVHTGGKLSVADIAFVPWGVNAAILAGGEDELFAGGKNAAYREWLDRVTAEPFVAEALKEKKELSGH